MLSVIKLLPLFLILVATQVASATDLNGRIKSEVPILQLQSNSTSMIRIKVSEGAEKFRYKLVNTMTDESYLSELDKETGELVFPPVISNFFSTIADDLHAGHHQLICIDCSEEDKKFFAHQLDIEEQKNALSVDKIKPSELLAKQ